jgi:hypothetical protein
LNNKQVYGTIWQFINRNVKLIITISITDQTSMKITKAVAFIYLIVGKINFCITISFVKMLSNNPNGKLAKWKHGNQEGEEDEASNQEMI